MNIAVFFAHKDKLKVLNSKWTSNVVPIFHSDYGKVGYKGIPLVYGQLADGPTRRRIKSSRDVGELVVNPIQLIRS